MFKLKTEEKLFEYITKFSDDEIENIFNKFKFKETENTSLKRSIRNFVELMIESKKLHEKIPQKLFHVTPNKNINKIKENGLIPKIGQRSKDLGEYFKAIYLFTNRENCDTALGDWLGEYFENISITILEIELPKNILIKSEVEYEIICYDIIEPKYITNFYDENWNNKKIIKKNIEIDFNLN
jgi:hypothetical protein